MSYWRIALLGLLVALLGACSAVAPAASPPSAASSAPAAPSGPSASTEAAASAAAPSPSPVQPTTGGSVSASTPSPTPSSSATPEPPLTLRADAFQAGGSIPSAYTCDGSDASPALSWTGVPSGTGSLVLLVDDPDAHSFAHWIAYAVPPDTTHLARGAGAAGSPLAQGTNDFGRIGYAGPCPPSGTHHYVFTLYALAAPLGLDGHPRASAVRAALAGAKVLGKAVLTATYARR